MSKRVAGLRTRDPNRFSLILILAIVCAGLVWIALSKYAIPPLIESAYHGESLPIFNEMISGQASHPIGEYFTDWDTVRWRVLVEFFLSGLCIALLIRPEFHRPLWRPAAPHHAVSVLEEKTVSSIPPPASFRRVLAVLAVLVLIGIAAARIVSTYYVFSQTFDEPDHLAAGIEWLDRRTYTVDLEHPPLARVVIALGPFLDGLRMPEGGGDWVHLGNQILYARDRYSHNLAMARLGVLPFFFLAAGVVWVWSRKVFGETSALIATLLFTTLPAVLAHSGLATTDMPLAATFMAAMLAFMYLLECPTYYRSCVLGLAIAVAILSKLSALLFLPACGLAMLACRWRATRGGGIPSVPRVRRAIAMALTVITAFLIIWSGYRFSVQSYEQYEQKDRLQANMGPVRDHSTNWHRLTHLVAEHAVIPAPEFIAGIHSLIAHNARGHAGYLLGEVRRTGWWYFFPITLAVKTPLPFVILSGIGLIILGGRGWRGADWRAVAPAAMAVTLLLVCMPARINIGVRHILSIYPLLSIVAGFGAVRLWSLGRPKRVGPAIVVVLLLWQLISSARIHPDYLAYFNELAGRHPERVLVVTDLDWGQDLLRLANVLHERKIDSVALAYTGTAEPSRHNLPQWRILKPCEPATGWVAISVQTLKIGQAVPPYHGYAWLEDYEPRELVGKSIRLYYIRENTRSRKSGDSSGTNECSSPLSPSFSRSP
jgi:4-amino-4-deoxy-L-arabinose transferase-like glycosyltransferase